MKRITMTVAMMLLGCFASIFAIAGDAEVEIASTNALTCETIPTDFAAQLIVANVDQLDILVVDDLVVNDNSLLGWTLGVVATNGTLNCAATSQTIAYTMQIANVSGTLGTGLTLAPASGADITLGATAISPTGTASTPTVDYTFDIVMDVAAAASANKLVGTYVETLTITLSAD